MRALGLIDASRLETPVARIVLEHRLEVHVAGHCPHATKTIPSTGWAANQSTMNPERRTGHAYLKVGG